MINFEAIRTQLDDVFSKYAIASIDDTKRICDEKNIDVIKVISEFKNEPSEIAVSALTLGVAIAIKKDTKLASYVAVDIGEGLQTFCSPGTEAATNMAGVGFGLQVSNKIKKVEDVASMIDYAAMLDFMEMTNDELTNITLKLSNMVEEIMKD